MPRPKLKIFLKIDSFLAPHIFNQLIPNIKICKSKNKLKALYRNLMMIDCIPEAF